MCRCCHHSELNSLNMPLREEQQPKPTLPYQQRRQQQQEQEQLKTQLQLSQPKETSAQAPTFSFRMPPSYQITEPEDLNSMSSNNVSDEINETTASMVVSADSLSSRFSELYKNYYSLASNSSVQEDDNDDIWAEERNYVKLLEAQQVLMQELQLEAAWRAQPEPMPAPMPLQAAPVPPVVQQAPQTSEEPIQVGVPFLINHGTGGVRAGFKLENHRLSTIFEEENEDEDDEIVHEEFDYFYSSPSPESDKPESPFSPATAGLIRPQALRIICPTTIAPLFHFEEDGNEIEGEEVEGDLLQSSLKAASFKNHSLSCYKYEEGDRFNWLAPPPQDRTKVKENLDRRGWREGKHCFL